MNSTHRSALTPGLSSHFFSSSQLSSSRPLISPRGIRAPELDEPPRAQDVPTPQEGRDVDVEGAVGLGAREEHAHGPDALEHAVGRRPRVLEEVEAYLARLQGDVGVDNRRGEAHPRRLQRVLRRNLNRDEPSAVWSLLPSASCLARPRGGGGSVGCVCVCVGPISPS